MNKLFVIGLMALVFSSCQSEPKKSGNVMLPTPNGVPSASSMNTASGQRPTHNPEHGQPFHDCAIPVGAPLVAENVTEQPRAVTAPANLHPEVQQQTTPPAQGVKLNPPHGEPGHKCEVAVGAPLS